MKHYPCTERYLGIIQSYQKAAFGHMFPKLRLVSAYQRGIFIDFAFYVDGEISEDDAESINLIDTYFGIDLSRDKVEQAKLDIICRKYPSPIHDFKGECLYARKETIPLVKNVKVKLSDSQKDLRLRILLAIQRAMVNHIFPRVRMIGISFRDHAIPIHVVVDGEISEEERLTLEEMRSCFLVQLPEEEIKICDLHIVRNDFPDNRDDFFDELVFFRKEYLDNAPLTPYDVYANM